MNYELRERRNKKVTGYIKALFFWHPPGRVVSTATYDNKVKTAGVYLRIITTCESVRFCRFDLDNV